MLSIENKHEEFSESQYVDMGYEILYGSGDSYKNVTYFFIRNCKTPKYPHLHFGDHLVGINKKIIIKPTDMYNFELRVSNNGKLRIKNVKTISCLDEKPLRVLYGAANYYRDVTDFLFIEDLDKYKDVNDIFGDHLIGHRKTLRIYISDIIIEINEKGEISNTTERLQKYLYNNDKKVIAFHSQYLSERDTNIALYDYADYNEKLLGNISIIIH